MRSLSLVPVLMLVVGCASPRWVAPQEFAAEEQRIMAPFMDAQTIVARKVRVTMTANFYDEFTRARVLPRVHEVKHERNLGGGSTYRFTAISLEPVMMFAIGTTKLAVEEELILQVLGGRHDLTLEVEAQAVTLAKGETQANMRTLRIADGLFHRSDRSR